MTSVALRAPRASRVLASACFVAGCSFSHGSPGGSQPGGSTAPDAPTTDPTVDTDHDGIPDVSDNCPTIANADQHDHDLDGRGDVCDVCPHLADTGADADGDGVGDACDPRPTEAGDRIVLFDGFYGPLQWNPVVGGPSWQASGGVLVQADANAAYQIVRTLSPAPNNVFAEARVHVTQVSPSQSSRHSIGLVVGYHAADDYFFCGVAQAATGAELDAGYVYPDGGSGSFSDNPDAFSDAMTGDSIVLQAQTTQGAADTFTHLDCTGQRAADHGNASYDAETPATGEIGLRTNGVAASFDYVFVVEVPAP